MIMSTLIFEIGVIVVTVDQERALRVIRQIYANTGFTPSARQLAEKLGCGVTKAYETIRALEDRGMLVFNQSRSQYVPADWRQLVSEGERGA